MGRYGTASQADHRHGALEGSRGCARGGSARAGWTFALAIACSCCSAGHFNTCRDRLVCLAPCAACEGAAAYARSGSAIGAAPKTAAPEGRASQAAAAEAAVEETDPPANSDSG